MLNSTNLSGFNFPKVVRIIYSGLGVFLEKIGRPRISQGGKSNTQIFLVTPCRFFLQVLHVGTHPSNPCVSTLDCFDNRYKYPMEQCFNPGEKISF